MTASVRRALTRDEWVVLVLTSVLHLAAATWLATHDLIFPDAMSRVANGYYTVLSRDPHLAAIGFVWNPLPSLATIPLLLASPVVPALASRALAGILVSAACGSWAMVLALRILRALGTPRREALVLTGVLSLQSLMLLAAATGASEAMLLAVCLSATLHLTRWLGDDEPWYLVRAGTALGLAYLVRYEAVAPAAAVTLLVLAVARRRSLAAGRPRGTALLDAVLVAGPVAAAVAGWAGVSRVVVGSWFPTFTSAYGNSAQVAQARESIATNTATGPGGTLGYVLDQLLHVAPLAPLLVVLALVVAWRRRDLRPLAAAAVLGAVLAFDEAAFLAGSSFGWLRFQQMAVPWGILMAGYLVGAAVTHRARGTRPGRARARGLVVVVVGALVALTPLGWSASLDPRLAREEALAREAAAAGQYRMQGEAAAYIDSLDLPDGSVITDVAYSFPIVLASDRPAQFVITPDRDFTDLLADPVDGGVLYALVTTPDASQADAVAARFPGIYEDGGGVAHLVRQWRDGRGTTWRLYAFDVD